MWRSGGALTDLCRLALRCVGVSGRGCSWQVGLDLHVSWQVGLDLLSGVVSAHQERSRSGGLTLVRKHILKCESVVDSCLCEVSLLVGLGSGGRESGGRMARVGLA